MMNDKKKMRLEYEVKSSPKILFSFLSTPNGLADWFADNVTIAENIYTFYWDKESLRAQLVAFKENKLVKFQWLDGETEYFELEIIQDEMTGDVALSVTDFSIDEEVQEKELIWNNQIEMLISVLGA